MFLPWFVLFILVDSMTNHRPRSNAYPKLVLEQYNDEEFRRHFRVSWQVYVIILELVKRHWNRRLDVEHCVLCFLWHIATRDSFRELSTRFGIGETSCKTITLQIA